MKLVGRKAKILGEFRGRSSGDSIHNYDNSGQETYKIKDFASSRFTYYTTDVKTDNSGAGTSADPKCVTTWNANGENLQSKYGGTNLDETADDKPMVKSGTIGGCSRCGGVSGVTFEYFYMDIDHGETDDNEVIRLVIEDTIDANGNGLRRTIWGINDEGRNLREVKILDPDGTPQFWCRSWKLNVNEDDARRYRLDEYRSPAAHNVTSSTIDEYLDPSANGPP